MQTTKNQHRLSYDLVLRRLMWFAFFDSITNVWKSSSFVANERVSVAGIRALEIALACTVLVARCALVARIAVDTVLVDARSALLAVPAKSAQLEKLAAVAAE